MADQPPPTSPRVDLERVGQAEVFIARHRADYADEALREQLRAAGYSDEEVRLAFGRAAVPPAPHSPPNAVALGCGLSLANFIAFPFLLLQFGLSAWVAILVSALLVAFEFSLAFMLGGARRLPISWLVALLVPLGLHLLFFGLCLVVLTESL